jgi:hypothetical protein
MICGEKEALFPLYVLSGTITESDGSTIITGATVEILDGYNAGASAVSNQYGGYLVTRVLTDVAFTERRRLAACIQPRPTRLRIQTVVPAVRRFFSSA